MILLFNPYLEDRTIFPTLPINLLSLSAFLKSKGIESKIYDLQRMTDLEIMNVLLDYNPSIVGIGCQFTTNYLNVLKIAKFVKSIVPKTKVVIGGNHASTLNRLDPNIDYIVKGEGELNFYDLCFEIKNGFNTNPVREPYPLIKNLDTLPIIDYSMIDLNMYTSYHSPFFMREPVLGIITSRGCPGNCIYCTVKGVWGRTWRGKSPKRTVDEMELLIDTGIKEFQFMDDSASVDKKRLEGVCDEIIERKMDIRWSTPNGIAHWTLDKSLLKKMKRAGCYRITLGIESGNEETRKFIKKDHSLKQAREIIDYANKIGMWTISTTILGFPGETKEMMYDTLRFTNSSHVDFTTFYLLDSYPTADIYKYNVDLTLAKKMRNKFYRSFIFHRILNFWNVIYKVRSWEDLKYLARVLSAGFFIIFRSFTMKTTKGLLYKS